VYVRKTYCMIDKSTMNFFIAKKTFGSYTYNRIILMKCIIKNISRRVYATVISVFNKWQAFKITQSIMARNKYKWEKTPETSKKVWTPYLGQHGTNNRFFFATRIFARLNIFCSVLRKTIKINGFGRLWTQMSSIKIYYYSPQPDPRQHRQIHHISKTYWCVQY